MVEVYARRLLAPERVKNCPFLEFSGCAVSDESPRRASGRGSPIRGCASPLSLSQWKSADSGRQVRAVSSSHSASGVRAGSRVWGNPATGFKVQLRCFAQEAAVVSRGVPGRGRSINIWRLSVFLARPSSAFWQIARKPSSSTSRSSRSSRSASPSRPVWSSRNTRSMWAGVKALPTMLSSSSASRIFCNFSSTRHSIVLAATNLKIRQSLRSDGCAPCAAQDGLGSRGYRS